LQKLLHVLHNNTISIVEFDLNWHVVSQTIDIKNGVLWILLIQRLIRYQ